MNTKCIHCGSTNILPYPEESPKEGYCKDCRRDTPLIDSNIMVKTIKGHYQWFINEYHWEPGCFVCDILVEDSNQSYISNAIIRFKTCKPYVLTEKSDLNIFYTCNGLEELFNLCSYNKTGFIICKIGHFF